MNKKTILITGGNGYIASLVKRQVHKDMHVITITRNEVDLSNPTQLQSYVENLSFDYLFHTSAMANTQACEQQPDEAYRINVESTKILANICKEKNARFVFISTEQCFNGKQKSGPFKEEEPLESVTTYGQHKIACEQYITQHLDNFLILRFSWMFGLSYPNVKASPNIIQNVLYALLHAQPTKFTVNEIRGMTYAQSFADQFLNILQLPTGIYHISDKNKHNTYESAKIVALMLGANQKQIETYILPDTQRYQDRFRDYRLDTSKIESHGIGFGTFEENVETCLQDFQLLRK